MERAGLLLRVLAPEQLSPLRIGLSFWIGGSFILLGVVSAFYASRQYAVVLRSLNPAEFLPGYRSRWAMLINVIVALLGFALLVLISLTHR